MAQKRNRLHSLIALFVFSTSIVGIANVAFAWGERHTVCSEVRIRSAESVPMNVPRPAGVSHCAAARAKTLRMWRNPAIQAVARAARNRFGIGRVATSPPGSTADNSLQGLVYNNTVSADPRTLAQRCWRKGGRMKYSYIAIACGTVELNR